MALEPLWKGTELLHRLLNDFLTGKLDTQLFCDDIVTAYNEAVDTSAFTPKEHHAFEALFDEAAWYNSDPPEAWEYPHYRTAEQIRAAAVKTSERLQKA